MYVSNPCRSSGPDQSLDDQGPNALSDVVGMNVQLEDLSRRYVERAEPHEHRPMLGPD